MTRIFNPAALQADENTFVTSLAFNTSDGVLTAQRNDGVDVTTDLDGRYLENVVEDTSPQLGGNLDLNNHNIDGTGNIDTTGTATFSGDLTVGTDALYVDATNKKAGVYNTNPSEALEVSGNVKADNFIGSIIGEMQFSAKAGEAITKGTPVYISSYDTTSEMPVVSIADSDDINKMPSFGLAESTVSLNDTVKIITIGNLSGIDTSTYAVNDILYISTSGTLTLEKPKGESSLIQNIAKVTRVHATLGTIEVGGPGRANDIPNLNNGHVFIGKSDNSPEARNLTLDDSAETTTNKHFTATEQSKLSGIEAGAQVNVQSNWAESDTTSDAFIKNKPTLITNNTHLNSATFNNTTRDLSLNMTDPTSTISVNIPESAAASTYVNSAAFNAANGNLTLGRTDGVDLTASIDGRYVTFNVTIPTGTYDLNEYKDGGIFAVDTTAKNIPTDFKSWVDELTLQVMESGADNGVQLLYTANGTSTVEIGRIYMRMWDDNKSPVFSTWRKVATENEYMPLHLLEPAYYDGDIDDLKDSGIYTVSSDSDNLPGPIATNAITVEVIRVFQSGSPGPLGIKQICRQNIHQANSYTIVQDRTYERVYSSSGVWSTWRLITIGGIPGDLRNSYTNANIDATPYNFYAGYYGLAGIGTGTGWPSNFPSKSDYNVLQTVTTGVSLNHGYQKLSCCDYDSSTTHVQEFKRVFDSSNMTNWYEYQFQGVPVTKEVLKPVEYLASTHGNNPDTSNTSLYVITLANGSCTLYGLSGGYAEGQKLRIMRGTNSTSVTLTIYHNSYYATQPIHTRHSNTLTLTGYESVDLMYWNNIWFVQGYDNNGSSDDGGGA
tara:strand:- start:261 stop:2762 length:2502 start_codon:yes stop_codon:yes gene_type:complete